MDFAFLPHIEHSPPDACNQGQILKQIFSYLELLFLVVCHVVQNDREKAKHKDGKGPRIGNFCRVSYKEVGRKCVKDLKS